MTEKDLIIIGGGPAGLSAARTALEAGQKVLIVDRNHELGGQLIKQTHKFFGSEKQYAKTRGITIARKLIARLEPFKANLEVALDTTVLGIYKDYVVTTLKGETYGKYRAKAIIVATGASEKVLAFENNDLPGIYGAGAVQTLMNLYGVLPGKEVVMIGSGNIGLIVSYQLMQAGVTVKAVIEAQPRIGGYKVHASKLRRLGVPIMTSTTIKKAFGNDRLEKIQIVGLDESWKEIPGTEQELYADTLCVSVGLAPMHQLLSMAEIRMRCVNELGGIVPEITVDLETSMANVFVCGDVVGVEEASSAMVEGSLAGLEAAAKLGQVHPDYLNRKIEYLNQLESLRCGPFGKKTLCGLERIKVNRNA